MELLENYKNQELTEQELNALTGGKLNMYQDADCTIFYEFDPSGNVAGSVWGWHA